MNLGRLLLCYGAVMLFSGCASLSKDECLTADWHLIGYEDGLNGNSPNRIGDHREACAKHGISPDRVAYNRGYEEGIINFCNFNRGVSSGQNGNPPLAVCPSHTEFHQGYQQGLASYCTFDSGYRHGLNGHSYRSVCSGEAEQDFLAGYDSGNHIYGLQTTLRELGEELEDVVDDQEENDKDIERLKGRIAYDESLTADQRRDMLERLENYNELASELAARHIDIEVQMESISRELSELGY